MQVNSIQKNEQKGTFSTILKSTGIGCLAGYAAKYMLPLTDEEMDNEYKETIKLIRTHTNKTKNRYLEEIRKIPNKTLAQDTFVKMLDVTKEEGLNNTQKAFKMRNIVKKAKLSESDSAQLSFMLKNINSKAKSVTKKYIKAYEGVLKGNRPLAWLLVPAGIVGFSVGLVKNIIKSES
ncbi:hypothetical protein IAC76_04315 [Spirochaetes bacterium]|uniref:Uncharacterized protein n=1 Tax=Candidatus Scatousia excrementipullorum TaxID=2840936 RepID=A0A9D9DSP2_9BACT|nr:hypothetical protein [Candidatus Scatousia excrementipullorum]